MSGPLNQYRLFNVCRVWIVCELSISNAIDVARPLNAVNNREENVEASVTGDGAGARCRKNNLPQEKGRGGFMEKAQSGKRRYWGGKN